jgi:hypothetical protein
METEICGCCKAEGHEVGLCVYHICTGDNCYCIGGDENLDITMDEDSHGHINYILEGREYCATFNDDGDCALIYSISEDRFLRTDNDSGDRERPHVWVAAYTMAEE